jgi:hypothetical protein
MPCGRERARRRRAVRCPRTAERPIGSALSASCKACGSVIARDLGVVIVIGVVVSAGALVATLSVSDQQRAVAAQRDRGDPDTDHVEAERLDRAACHILAGGQRDARLAPLDLHSDVLVAESVAECERLGDEPLRWCRSVEAHDNGRTLRDDEALAVVVQNGAIGQVAAAPQRGGPPRRRSPHPSPCVAGAWRPHHGRPRAARCARRRSAPSPAGPRISRTVSTYLRTPGSSRPSSSVQATRRAQSEPDEPRERSRPVPAPPRPLRSAARQRPREVRVRQPGASSSRSASPGASPPGATADSDTR